MATSPTLFEMFDDADLATWEARINEGIRPTPDELKEILCQNRERPLPDWLLDVVILAIDGDLPAKRGRRRQGPLKAVQWALAATEYEKTLAPGSPRTAFWMGPVARQALVDRATA